MTRSTAFVTTLDTFTATHRTGTYTAAESARNYNADTIYTDLPGRITGSSRLRGYPIPEEPGVVLIYTRHGVPVCTYTPEAGEEAS